MQLIDDLKPVINYTGKKLIDIKRKNSQESIISKFIDNPLSGENDS